MPPATLDGPHGTTHLSCELDWENRLIYNSALFGFVSLFSLAFPSLSLSNFRFESKRATWDPNTFSTGDLSAVATLSPLSDRSPLQRDSGCRILSLMNNQQRASSSEILEESDILSRAFSVKEHVIGGRSLILKKIILSLLFPGCAEHLANLETTAEIFWLYLNRIDVFGKFLQSRTCPSVNTSSPHQTPWLMAEFDHPKTSCSWTRLPAPENIWTTFVRSSW